MKTILGFVSELSWVYISVLFMFIYHNNVISCHEHFIKLINHFASTNNKIIELQNLLQQDIITEILNLRKTNIHDAESNPIIIDDATTVFCSFKNYIMHSKVSFDGQTDWFMNLSFKTSYLMTSIYFY